MGPMGHMGSIDWGMGTGMVDRKWEGNGNSSVEEIPVSRVIPQLFAVANRLLCIPATSAASAELRSNVIACNEITKFNYKLQL